MSSEPPKDPAEADDKPIDAIPLAESSNPYSASLLASLPAAQPTSPKRPRLWSAFAVGILSLPLAFSVSAICLVVAMLADAGVAPLSNPHAAQRWVENAGATRLGFLVLVWPGQIVFLLTAFAAAAVSPLGIRERLRLHEGRLPMWTWLILAIGTPALGMLSSALLSLIFSDTSEHMEMLLKMFRSHRGLFTAVVVASIAILPGVSEEVLFRGYLQSRLLKRLPVGFAIAISSCIFAIAHVDPQHVLAVIPLGIWLGIVAWKADSIWPSIVCHMVNNAIAVALTYANESTAVGVELDTPTLAVLAVSSVAMLASIPILIRYGNEPPIPSFIANDVRSPIDLPNGPTSL